MNKPQVINMAKVPEKWLKLMLHLQNAVPGVFQLIFPDATTARKANDKICAVIDRNPTWFHLLILQRKTSIFVIKTQHMQKVVVKDELP